MRTIFRTRNSEEEIAAELARLKEQEELILPESRLSR